MARTVDPASWITCDTCHEPVEDGHRVTLSDGRASERCTTHVAADYDRASVWRVVAPKRGRYKSLPALAVGDRFDDVQGRRYTVVHAPTPITADDGAQGYALTVTYASTATDGVLADTVRVHTETREIYPLLDPETILFQMVVD